MITRAKLSSLKKLDVSNNTIFDKGFETLASGQWPSLEHLIFHATQITEKGFLTLLEVMNWPKIERLENSFIQESLQTDRVFDPEKSYLSKVIPTKMTLRFSDSDSRYLLAVLDTDWLFSTSTSISLDKNREVRVLHLEKWNQLED